MQTKDEKLAFAERLRQALKRSPKKIETAAELAIQFSLRHPDASITAQAAQKWLTGKARPTPDKIETLARWLDVSPTWLRHGLPDAPRPVRLREADQQAIVPDARESLMLRRLRGMSEARRNLVEDLVEQLALDDEVWRRE